MSVSRREFLKVGLMGSLATLTGFREREISDLRIEAMLKGLDKERFIAHQTPVMRETDQGEVIGPTTISEIDFEIGEIESLREGRFQNFYGYIRNVTGDAVNWRVPIASLDLSKKGWNYTLAANPARSLEQSIEPDRVYYSYALIARGSIYDNKVFNILTALNDFRFRALPGFAPGETISYLEMIDIGRHLEEMDEEKNFYYLNGWVIGGGGLVIDRAGGVCASVTTMAKAAYKAAKLGYVEFVERTPHAYPYGYRINPFDKDTVDATAYYQKYGGIDLIIRNIGKRRLYFVPRAEVQLPEMKEGEVLTYSLSRPSSARLSISMAITDETPTLESSISVEESLRQFTEFRKTFGRGEYNGFDLW